MKWSLRVARRTPLLQVVKSVVATIAAWLVAGALIPGPPPVFAAIAALLTVQPSVGESFGRGVERTVGVITGVLVASAIGLLLGNGFWAIALAVAAALLLAWGLRAAPGTANQVAISAMLVLALGSATPGYAVDRVLETAIGALIGLIVNVVIVPPLSLAPAQQKVGAVNDATARSLEALADALVAPQSAAQLQTLLDDARLLRGSVADAERALTDARSSLALNPRGRTRAREVDALESDVQRLFAIVTQTIGMTRAFVDDYDDTISADREIGSIAEQLHRAGHDLRLTSPGTGAPVSDEPPALTRPLEVNTVPPRHWMLIGSLLVDLRRIHEGIARPTPAASA
ncbi:FUSC family protein [Microbacterium sp. bgisy203]|uniref:FUSC family protein n=1 Tax=Microbacterium sp. bgisy203 TaxID=3413799 RepID=UPI003D716246